MIEVLKDLGLNKNIVLPVESSNISTIAYNPSTEVLTILFKRGNIYQYTDVSKDVVAKLITADSIGKEFRNSILNQYDFIRLRQDGSIMYFG